MVVYQNRFILEMVCGIISPILLCIYIGEVLPRINWSGLGCHVGRLSYAGLGYADHVLMLTPFISALLQLVSFCEQLADFNVLFNVKKNVCVCGSGATENSLHALLHYKDY